MDFEKKAGVDWLGVCETAIKQDARSSVRQNAKATGCALAQSRL